MRLGVLGGTFDPVHCGHLALARHALKQLALDRVLFVPAGQPWRKPDRTIAPAHHRLAMLHLAIEGNEAFEIAAMEVDRPGPSYTAETLAALSEEQEAELFFIMGEDALADLPNWREPERILELATLVVAHRTGSGDAGRAEMPSGPSARIVWLEMPLLDISASAIRERVSGRLPIRDLVPEAVESYIREHGLYLE